MIEFMQIDPDVDTSKIKELLSKTIAPNDITIIPMECGSTLSDCCMVHVCEKKHGHKGAHHAVISMYDTNWAKEIIGFIAWKDKEVVE
jgi:hypothetical protein